MDLWIRSQDREDLIKADNLGLAYLEKYNFVDKIGDIHRKEYHICQFTDNTHITLGYYKTKERALEVLDEIQKILKPQLIIKDSGKIIGSFEDTIIREGATYELKELSTYVYEMPKE